MESLTLPPKEDIYSDDIKDIRDQIKAYDFKAGLEDYELFLGSPVWDDLKANLEERVNSCLKSLENLSNTHTADIVYKSRLHELRQLLAYPSTVINLYKAMEEDSDVPIS